MSIFNEHEIHYGAGVFEQAMRSQTSIPGRSNRMTAGAAIGVLSAAVRSGLPANLIDEIIPQHFGESATLLSRVLKMYEGDDWSINLWHLQPSSRYKLCTDLCLPGQPLWRYAPLRDDDA